MASATALPCRQGPAVGSVLPRTLVLGLGNPILSDDAVGLAVVRQVAGLLLARTGVTIAESTTGGLDLIELLSGYERAVVVDAIALPDEEPGTLLRLTPESLPPTERLSCAHEVDLATALDLGRELALDMPAEVVVWAVQVEDALTLGESLSPRVAAAVSGAAARIVDEVLNPTWQPCTGHGCIHEHHGADSKER